MKEATLALIALAAALAWFATSLTGDLTANAANGIVADLNAIQIGE